MFLLQRGNDAFVPFAFPERWFVNSADVSQLIAEGFHDLFSKVLVSHLTAAEDDAYLNLVSILDEASGVSSFGVQVMHADLRGKLHLLKLGGLLVLPCFFGGFLLLEFEFAVIEDLADWRFALWSDAIEVQSVFHGKFIGGSGRHFPELLPFRPDYQHFRITDVFVDGVLVFVRAAIWLLVVGYGNYLLWDENSAQSVRSDSSNLLVG